MQVLINKFSCAKKVYKIAIKWWRIERLDLAFTFAGGKPDLSECTDPTYRPTPSSSTRSSKTASSERANKHRRTAPRTKQLGHLSHRHDRSPNNTLSTVATPLWRFGARRLARPRGSRLRAWNNHAYCWTTGVTRTFAPANMRPFT